MCHIIWNKFLGLTIRWTQVWHDVLDPCYEKGLDKGYACMQIPGSTGRVWKIPWSRWASYLTKVKIDMSPFEEGAHERAMASGRDWNLYESLLKELMSAQWRSPEMENLSESFYGRSWYMFKRAFWIQVPMGNRMFFLRNGNRRQSCAYWLRRWTWQTWWSVTDITVMTILTVRQDNWHNHCSFYNSGGNEFILKGRGQRNTS